MATIELTKDNFVETIQNSEIVLVDFWAPWCEPCKNFEPIFDKASDTHADITFGKVNTDSEPEIAAQLGVQSIPTLVVFREQIGLLAQPGSLPENALDSVIEQVKGLDMDEVRAEMEKQQESPENDEHGCGGCGCGSDDENC